MAFKKAHKVKGFRQNGLKIWWMGISLDLGVLVILQILRKPDVFSVLPDMGNLTELSLLLKVGQLSLSIIRQEFTSSV